jgi:GST-like protein
MLRFYYHPTPNPLKIALMLEELGLPYETVTVDTLKGDQHAAAFRSINPNGKVPAITDGAVTVFDSTAILLYLAEKSGRFLPTDPAARGEALSWLMFVATGLGPFSGQAIHFLRVAPEPKEYPVKRYSAEIDRHYRLLDARLAGRDWIVGDAISIVDISAWGWARYLPYITGEAGYDAYPNVKRWYQAIEARPAAQRALALATKVTVKQDWDAEALANLFPHTHGAAAA